jgi:pimeloyl-ACP methyl ester carboxylesterase
MIAIVWWSVMLIETGGIELHYDTHGEGEPLVWLHGSMGHGPDWQYIFEGAPSGFRLIAPDLRGHGRSTAAEPTYSFRQSGIDVLALLDHLQVERAKVIGLSGGGITALHMATMQPARVDAMVVVSAPARFPEQAKAIQRIFSEGMLSEAERQLMHQRHQRPGQFEHLIAQVRAMPDGDDPNFTREQMATISADTLIVFGDRDPLYSVSLALELREAIPQSWLWVVPNGGHGPVFGPHAPVFVETALAFLGGAFRVPQHSR